MESAIIKRAIDQLIKELGEHRHFVKGPTRHVRAGYTTNKGNGQSKKRRRMAKESRRINRV